MTSLRVDRHTGRDILADYYLLAPRFYMQAQFDRQFTSRSRRSLWRLRHRKHRVSLLEPGFTKTDLGVKPSNNLEKHVFYGQRCMCEVYGTVRKDCFDCRRLAVVRPGFSFVKSPLFQPSLPNLWAASQGPTAIPVIVAARTSTLPIAARLATLNGHAAHHVLQQSLLKLRLLESQSLVREKSLPN